MQFKVEFCEYGVSSWADWSEYVLNIDAMNKKVESDNDAEAGVIYFDNAVMAFRYTSGNPVYAAMSGDLTSKHRYLIRITAEKPATTAVQMFEGMIDFTTIEWPTWVMPDSTEHVPAVQFEVVDKLAALNLVQSVNCRSALDMVSGGRIPNAPAANLYDVQLLHYSGDTFSVHVGINGGTPLLTLSSVLFQVGEVINAAGYVMSTAPETQLTSEDGIAVVTESWLSADNQWNYIKCIFKEGSTLESALRAGRLVYVTLNGMTGVPTNTTGGTYLFEKNVYGINVNVLTAGALTSIDALLITKALVSSRWASITFTTSQFKNHAGTLMTQYLIPAGYALQLVDNFPFQQEAFDALKWLVDTMETYVFMARDGNCVLQTRSSLATVTPTSFDVSRVIGNATRRYFWDKLVDAVEVGMNSWKTLTATDDTLTSTGYASYVSGIKPRNVLTRNLIVDLVNLGSTYSIVNGVFTYNPDTSLTEEEALTLYGNARALDFLNFYGKRHEAYDFVLPLVWEMFSWEPLFIFSYKSAGYFTVGFTFDLNAHTFSWTLVEVAGHSFDLSNTLIQKSETDYVGSGSGVASSSSSVLIGGSGGGAYTAGEGLVLANREFALDVPISLLHGGTGGGLVAANGGVLYSTATSLAIKSAGSAGQLFVSTGANAPAWKTLSEGANIAIVQDATTITISANTADIVNDMHIRGSLYMLNKTEDNWQNFAIRDTSGSAAVFNMSHVGTLSAISFTASSLTTGRVPFISTAGLLIDSATLLYTAVDGLGTTNAINIYANSNTDYDGCGLWINKSRGTFAAPTAVSDGHFLGFFNWQGYNNGAYKHAAGVDVHVDGAPGTSGNYNVPGRIEFKTGDNTDWPVVRMVINSAGHVGIGSGTTLPYYLTLKDTGTAGSVTFASGFGGNGWRLYYTADSKYEYSVDNLWVRGTMHIYELLIHQIRATNGSVWVSNGVKVFSVTSNGGGVFTCTIDTKDAEAGWMTLQQGDLIRAKRFRSATKIYDCVGVVTQPVTDTVFVITVEAGFDAPAAGMEFVRLGSTDSNRQGSIYLTADDNLAPFIRIYDGVTTWASFGTATTVKTQIGKLDGLSDSDMGAMTGYGLYSQKVFLRGTAANIARIILTTEAIAGLSIGGPAISVSGYSGGWHEWARIGYLSSATNVGVWGLRGGFAGTPSAPIVQINDEGLAIYDSAISRVLVGIPSTVGSDGWRDPASHKGGNLVTNPDFATNLTGWTYSGGVTRAQNSLNGNNYAAQFTLQDDYITLTTPIANSGTHRYQISLNAWMEGYNDTAWAAAAFVHITVSQGGTSILDIDMAFQASWYPGDAVYNKDFQRPYTISFTSLNNTNPLVILFTVVAVGVHNGAWQIPKVWVDDISVNMLEPFVDVSNKGLYVYASDTAYIKLGAPYAEMQLDDIYGRSIRAEWLGVGVTRDVRTSNKRDILVRDYGSIGSVTFNSAAFGGYGWGIEWTQTSAPNAAVKTGTYTGYLDNLVVRGSMRVYELVIQQIRATNGSLLITSSGKVEAFVSGTVSVGNSIYVKLAEVPCFKTDDLIRFRRANFNGSGDVTVIQQLDCTVLSVDYTTRIIRIRVEYMYGSTTFDFPNMEFVRLGSASDATRKGSIYLSADDSNAPFIDIYDGVHTFAEFGTASMLKARLGNLSGITDANVGLSGTAVYGLYSTSVYLRGVIVADTGYIGGTAGWQIATKTIQSVTTGIKLFADASARYIAMGATLPTDINTGIGIWMSGASTAEFRVGNPAANYLKWDGSVLSIVGTVTANAGTIGGWSIASTQISKTSGFTNVYIVASGAPVTGVQSGFIVKTDIGQEATYAGIVTSLATPAYTNTAFFAGFDEGQHSNIEDALVPFRVTYGGAMYARSGQIGATVITSDALTGGIIRTAATGQRVVIDTTSGGQLRFYDDSRDDVPIVKIGNAIGDGSYSGIQVLYGGGYFQFNQSAYKNAYIRLAGGYLTAGEFYATNDATSVVGKVTAVLAVANVTGGNDQAIALYGSAIGAVTCWAGYFDNGNVYIKNALHVDGLVLLKELTEPNTPASGFGYLFVGTDSKLYFKNDNDRLYDLTAVVTPADIYSEAEGKPADNVGINGQSHWDPVNSIHYQKLGGVWREV